MTGLMGPSILARVVAVALLMALAVRVVDAQSTGTAPAPALPDLGTSAAGTSAPPAAVMPADAAQTIDLAAALRLAGLNNLDLALVRAAQSSAQAVNDAATMQFFPWLSAGASYSQHSGATTEVGELVEENSQLAARGAALNEQVRLGDAILEKLAARQRARAAGYDVEASRNDTAFAAASAYFDLVNAVATTEIAAEAVRISQQYEDELERAYQAGLTNRSEVLRISVQTQRYRVTQRQAQAMVRSQSAALATLLRLDPAADLQPTERIVNPPTLVEVDIPVQTLIQQALAYRPEAKSSQATIAAMDKDRIAAKFGPLIPSLTGQAALSQLRGGQDDVLRGYWTAHDYIVALNWRFGPGGLFDFSRIEAANSALQTARLRAEKIHDDIAEQVVQAYEAARASLDQMRLARHAVELADQSLTLSRQRREFGVYAVLEIIQAQQDLTQSRSDYAQALTQYAKAQYALARATARIGAP
jgi:outer membrane protein TolC